MERDGGGAGKRSWRLKSRGLGETLTGMRGLLILALVLFATVASFAQITNVQPQWAVVSSALNWESPPPEAELRIQTADAEIMVFFPDGTFAAIRCLLIREESGSIGISRGDGERVRVGKWSLMDTALTVKSRVVYATVRIPGQPIPSADSEKQLTAQRDASGWSISNAEERYVPLPPGFRDWDYLSSLIRCDRDYYDGAHSVEGPQPCMPGG